jgi:hypothetical protein
VLRFEADSDEALQRIQAEFRSNLQRIGLSLNIPLKLPF